MNKTEMLMSSVIYTLKQSNKKYFIVCQDNKGTQYIDGSNDIEFLREVLENLEELLNSNEE